MNYFDFDQLKNPWHNPQHFGYINPVRPKPSRTSSLVVNVTGYNPMVQGSDPLTVKKKDCSECQGVLFIILK